MKEGRDCALNCCFPSVNNFIIDFPKGNFKEKSLVMAASIFIDYMMFEDDGKNAKTDL